MFDAYFISVNGPEQLSRAIEKASHGYGDQQAPVYLRQSAQGLVAKRSTSALFWTQRRRNFYALMPDYLLGCGLQVCQRIETGLDLGLLTELRLDHPRYRAVGHNDVMEESLACAKLPSFGDLSMSMRQLRRRDWICLPGTQAAYDSAMQAVADCGRFYDLAEGSQFQLCQAGIFNGERYLDPAWRARNIAAAQTALSTLERLSQPEEGFGSFAELAERVQRTAHGYLSSFLRLQLELNIDEPCSALLVELGLEQSESVSSWLHRLWERGEWLYETLVQPDWHRKLGQVLANWPVAEARSPELRQISQILARMHELGLRLFQQRSPERLRLFELLDAQFTARPMAPAAADELGQLLFSSLQPQLEPSAPALDEQRLLQPADYAIWEAHNGRPPLTHLTEVLQRPAGLLSALPAAGELCRPQYGSWSQDKLCVVQDHVLAGLLQWRLEAQGHADLAGHLWAAMHAHERLSDTLWALPERSAAQLTQSLITLASQLDALQQDCLRRPADELRCALGGLVQRAAQDL